MIRLRKKKQRFPQDIVGKTTTIQAPGVVVKMTRGLVQPQLHISNKSLGVWQNETFRYVRVESYEILARKQTNFKVGKKKKREMYLIYLKHDYLVVEIPGMPRCGVGGGDDDTDYLIKTIYSNSLAIFFKIIFLNFLLK